MIRIEVTETKKGMHVEAEFKMDTYRKRAREMFIEVMHTLNRADHELFMEAFHKIVEEEIDDFMESLDINEEGGDDESSD